MSVIVSFNGWKPVPRYDELPWTEVRIEEASIEDGVYTQLEVIPLDPLDSDPSDPQARSFTTELGTAIGYWYRLVFADADGDTMVPTQQVQNTVGANVYATSSELARILKIRTPTSEQSDAMQRVLVAASGEIDAEIDLADDDGLEQWHLAIMEEVCLERAVEHWRQQESPFGLMVLGVDTPAERAARDSWERHALKLAPVKRQWGFA